MGEQIVKHFTFRDVHKELQKESEFTKTGIDREDFVKKGEFLENIGFINSITTKMYKDMSNVDFIQEINSLYGHSYKFILDAQLERICEKYDLYQRPINHFLGQIPQHNVKEIMNFKIRLKDIVNKRIEGIDFDIDKNIKSFLIYEQYIKNNQEPRKLKDTSNESIRQLELDKQNYNQVVKKLESEVIWFHRIKTIMNEYRTILETKDKFVSLIEADEIYRILTSGETLITIAATKNLFPQSSTEKGERLWLRSLQLSSSGSVDLDPIVLCKLNKGYLVITAWGDEANDELIYNELKN